MKKLAFFALIALVAISCRKPDDDDDDNNGSTAQTYEQRLAGSWDLDEVDYSFELPSIIPGSPPTQIDGAANNVTGNFTITQDPNRVTWDYSFDVNITGIGSLPVTSAKSGDWTLSSNEEKIFIDLDDGTTSTLEVISNEENTQVFSTVVTQEVPVVGDVDVDAVITLVRQP
jgi:hypothetical protein